MRGRTRTLLLLGAGLAAATTLVALQSGGGTYTARLDPANPGPDGGQAVARVLAEEGVQVEVVRDAAALERAEITSGTEVVVTSSGNLGASTLRRLRRATTGAPLVLVDPPIALMDLLGQEQGVLVGPGQAITAGCADPRFTGLRIRVDRARTYPGASGCFVIGGGAVLLPGGSEPAVLGAGDLLTNGQITAADNAAVALRLLGAGPRLVWYVPDRADLVADDAVGLSSLLPRWLVPGLWTVGLTLVGLLLWRGRRMGPLVEEPLPVAVTAIETTLSRGRLYRRTRDRGHAAQALRAGARSRLVGRLGLPRGAVADTEALVREVARHTARDPSLLRRLLSPHSPAPATEKDLTELAADLAELDREVRRR